MHSLSTIKALNAKAVYAHQIKEALKDSPYVLSAYRAGAPAGLEKAETFEEALAIRASLLESGAACELHQRSH